MKKFNKIRLISYFTIICLLVSVVIVGALTNTPYHTHSRGATLKTESYFCGNVPGTGKYKTKKGKYIKQAWVEIKEGGKRKAYKESKIVSKASEKVTYASISCINNPLKSQSFPYGWRYR